MNSDLLGRLAAEMEVPNEDSEALFVRLRTAWNWSTDVSPGLTAEELITTGRALEVEAEVPFFASEGIAVVGVSAGLAVPMIRIGGGCDFEPPISEASARRFYCLLRAACDEALRQLAQRGSQPTSLC